MSMDSIELVRVPNRLVYLQRELTASDDDSAVTCWACVSVAQRHGLIPDPRAMLGEFHGEGMLPAA